ncbi:DUF222 domain-containing protein [Geodermatophilus sp. CPCC 206100]|uniref:HNH endonuclease n=1 Tax=Geodermatophilus sp. CPCC 206100 TaxID=3020054 RepID=UPI003B00229B
MSGTTAEHPSGSPLPELALAITAGAVRMAAATAAWLRLVAEFDERGGWEGVGIRSCGHWLAWQCGLSPGAAREHVRVARTLRELPRIEAAFAAGRLSYSKVRALTRVAAPDCEEALLEFARCATASQTERFCRQWRRVDDAEAAAETREASLAFEHWTDDDGVLTLEVRMPAEAGAALMAAIDSLAEREARRERAQNVKAAARHAAVRAGGGTVDAELARRCAEDHAAGLARERTAARRIAALSVLAEARVGLDRRPGDPPRREVVVHVDAGVLAEDEAAGRAHVEGGPALSGAQARRLLCEATVVAMLEEGREPLAVGRRKRRATRAQRRALLRRDGGCARPGCPETRIERLHAHHMRHWLFGGRTDLANLVLLCDADHGQVHDQGLVVARQQGRLVVTAPDGRRVWGTADAAFRSGLAGLTAGPADPTAELDRAHAHAGAQARAGADRPEIPGEDAFTGVHPLDTAVGRRPLDAPPSRPVQGERRTSGRALLRRSAVRRRPLPVNVPSRRDARPSGRAAARPGPAGRSRDRTTPRPPTGGPSPAALSARMDAALFPGGPPRLPATLQDHHDRMDLEWAVSVLMGHREFVRRLATEAGVPATS